MLDSLPMSDFGQGLFQLSYFAYLDWAAEENTALAKSGDHIC